MQRSSFIFRPAAARHTPREILDSATFEDGEKNVVIDIQALELALPRGQLVPLKTEPRRADLVHLYAIPWTNLAGGRLEDTKRQ